MQTTAAALHSLQPTAAPATPPSRRPPHPLTRQCTGRRHGEQRCNATATATPCSVCASVMRVTSGRPSRFTVSASAAAAAAATATTCSAAGGAPTPRACWRAAARAACTCSRQTDGPCSPAARPVLLMQALQPSRAGLQRQCSTTAGSPGCPLPCLTAAASPPRHATSRCSCGTHTQAGALQATRGTATAKSWTLRRLWRSAGTAAASTGVQRAGASVGCGGARPQLPQGAAV